MMQSSTGQAAWQMEQANAPKQRSGSMMAIFFGGFLRGRFINLVHIGGPIIADFPRRIGNGPGARGQAARGLPVQLRAREVYVEWPRAAMAQTASTMPLRTAYIRSYRFTTGSQCDTISSSLSPTA